MSVDGHHCRQLGPCYGHLEHFILVHIPSMILIYVLGGNLFFLCLHYATMAPAFYNLFPVSRMTLFTSSYLVN